MTKAILLQILEDKRVQRLVIAAIKMKEEFPLVNEKNVIAEMKKELRIYKPHHIKVGANGITNIN